MDREIVTIFTVTTHNTTLTLYNTQSDALDRVFSKHGTEVSKNSANSNLGADLRLGWSQKRDRGRHLTHLYFLFQWLSVVGWRSTVCYRSIALETYDTHLRAALYVMVKINNSSKTHASIRQYV